MRRNAKWAAALVAVAALTLVAAPGATGQGVANSDHNFSTTGWAKGEICLPCHTPHHAIAGEWPLWNHTLTSATFTFYTSHAMDATTPTEVSGSSKKCLGCHDGTVALDAFGGQVGSTFISGDAGLGTDLSVHHPISIVYDAALATADGELHDPAGLDSRIHLIQGKLECGTCHDAHNTDGWDNMLVMSNAGSALCLGCHDK